MMSSEIPFDCQHKDILKFGCHESCPTCLVTYILQITNLKIIEIDTFLLNQNVKYCFYAYQCPYKNCNNLIYFVIVAKAFLESTSKDNFINTIKLIENKVNLPFLDFIMEDVSKIRIESRHLQKFCNFCTRPWIKIELERELCNCHQTLCQDCFTDIMIKATQTGSCSMCQKQINDENLINFLFNKNT